MSENEYKMEGTSKQSSGMKNEGKNNLFIFDEN